MQKNCENNSDSILFKKKLIVVLIGIANNYHMLGESAENNKIRVEYFESSIAFDKKALHISKSINGVLSINCASLYDNMALMYANIKQFKYAYSNSKLARSLFRKLKGEISFEMAKCYINLGEIYRLDGKEEKALIVFKIAE